MHVTNFIIMYSSESWPLKKVEKLDWLYPLNVEFGE